MFTLLTLATQVLTNAYKITDKASWRAFLLELVSLIQSRALETGIALNDAELKHIKFALHNEALFDYVYRQISEQFQTEEILFESADENAITELCNRVGNMPTTTRRRSDGARNEPEAINPALIIAMVSQIISIINTIKQR